jgi:diguanylate cyclase (GGDEF)-like protein
VHAAGDQVLHDLSALLASNVRGNDVVCRYGGEEFIILLPECPLERAVERAEQLRNQVKELRLLQGDKYLGEINVSIGVAASSEHGQSRDQVIKAADSALYQAKNTGRDRVCVASASCREPLIS